MSWSDWVHGKLEERQQRGQLRTLRALSPEDAVHVRADGRRVTLFSSNDYLGLSFHPEVRARVARAAQTNGQGPRGSALVCGHTTHHARLAQGLAELKGTQAALLCPTGYAANLSVLGSLAEPGVAIFSDALNHASIIDAIGLAKRRGAVAFIYRHNDTAHLADLMKRCQAPRKVIVTDGVFSMDGDLARLPELVALKREHDALLVVDDAHGTLVLGPQGQGTAHALGCAQDVDIHIGTLSKAFGAQGGFVAASHQWVHWLLNAGRAFVYSTAIGLGCVESAQAALELCASQPALRATLWAHVAHVRDALGIKTQSPIVPIMLGTEAHTMQVARALFEQGYHVGAIRPPTVPEGTARLRLTLSAAHTTEDVRGLCDLIQSLR